MVVPQSGGFILFTNDYAVYYKLINLMIMKWFPFKKKAQKST